MTYVMRVELSWVESNHLCSSEICVFWFRQNVRAIQCKQFYKLDEMNATAAHRNTSHDFRKITRTQQQQTNKQKKKKGNQMRFGVLPYLWLKASVVLLRLCVTLDPVAVEKKKQNTIKCNALWSFPFRLSVHAYLWSIFSTSSFVIICLPYFLIW